MQYICLIYTAPGSGPEYGTPEFDAMMAGYFKVTEDMKTAGVLVAGDALQGVETATSVRVRAGKTETMDGPFAETKEQLGGYYLIDCKDLDEALGWAAKIPGSQHGTIEVRPVVTDYT